MTPPTMTPAEVKAVRAQTGLNQAAFGKLLRVGQSEVSHWENGSRAVPAHAADRLRYIQTMYRAQELLAEGDTASCVLLKTGGLAVDDPKLQNGLLLDHLVHCAHCLAFAVNLLLDEQPAGPDDVEQEEPWR